MIKDAGTATDASGYWQLLFPDFPVTDPAAAASDDIAIVGQVTVAPPVISGTKANQATSDLTPITPFSSVTVTNANGSKIVSLTVTMSASQNGTLSNLGAGNFSGGVYAIVGSPGAVTAALEGLVFTPTIAQVAPDQSVTTTFRINDASGGSTTSDATTSVIATAADQPTYIVGTVPDQRVTDRSTISPFTTVNLIDPNGGQTQTMTVTLSTSANGALSNLGGFTANGSANSYTDTGTTDQVLSALNGMVFTPNFLPGVVGQTTNTTTFTLTDIDTAGNSRTDANTSVIASAAPVLTTRESFNYSSANGPVANLITDADGDLISSLEQGGPVGDGGVFSLSKTATGYATAPAILINFDDTASGPISGLLADAAGNLIGTTTSGGPSGYGSVFVLQRTAAGYVFSILAGFNSTDGADPYGTPIADTAGNLFGTTFLGGTAGVGTVYEIVKVGTGYDPLPSTLINFTGGADGGKPRGGLVADSAGDLFGTTSVGGGSDDGTIFEIVRSNGVLATTVTTLATFTGTGNGSLPWASLLIDAAGDLFGTTFEGGTRDAGTVFELPRTNGVYATSVETLVTFDDQNGGGSRGALIADAAGDLFGTTQGGGANDDGTVFEIPRTATGYASTPVTLAGFVDSIGIGSLPAGGLLADVAGNLYGTTAQGGVADSGTVFELSSTGLTFVPVIAGTTANQTLADRASITPFSSVTIADGNSGQLESVIVRMSSPLNGTLSDLGGGSYSTGIYTVTGTAAQVSGALEGLVFTPTIAQVPAGQTVTTTFSINDVNTAGALATDTTTSVIATSGATPGPSIAGTEANQTTTDLSQIDPFASATITDGNPGQTETVTVTLSVAANGTLSNLSGGSFSAGVYSDKGTASQVTAALEALVFTPTPAQVPPGQTVTTGFTIVDTDTAMATATDATTSVVATAEGPRVLLWTGDAGTSFAAPGNWNDTTSDVDPATAGAMDTVQFNNSEAGVTGTGMVATIDVGSTGSGVLNLSGNATLFTNSLDAGVVAGAVGQIGLSGTGAEIDVAGSATVADDGTGVLSILSGATFDADSLTIGSQSDSSGALVVSGAGSAINVTGALNIGTALGIGDLTVGPGAAVHASVVNLQGQVVLEGGLLDPTVNLINQGQTAGGFGTIAAGDIIDEGVIQAGGNKTSQKLLLVAGTVLGGGTLTVNGTQPGSSPTGVLQINAGGTMELTGPVINAATTTFTDNLTPTGTYTVNNSVVDVTFADAAGVLKLDDIAGFAGTITTFHTGDSFVITGGTLSDPNVVNGNTLTFADSGVNAGAGGIDSIIFASPISAAGMNIVNNNTLQIACFAVGTRIATASGLVAVEALSAGQHVLTHDGRSEPIVWLGQRTVRCDRHPKPASVWPVRVRAGAFGENVPLRDLYLSPDHAVFINDVLVPVKLMLNGTSIVQIKRDQIAYHHVELRRHDVILAEGLEVESYLDTGDRANFGGGGTIRLFPDFAARLGPEAATVWETRGVAPLVTTGGALAAARAVVAVNRPAGKPSLAKGA